MNIIKALSAGLFAVSVCIALEVNISGTVSDTGSSPIAGATVKLEKIKLTTTTGVDGSFTLSGATAINDQINDSKPHTLSATINNGFIRINITEKSEVSINTYTLQGKALSSIKKTLDAGAHSMKLTPFGAGVYVYQVKTGNEKLLIKNYSMGGVSIGTSASTNGSSPSVFAKFTMSYDTINDVIAVTEDGYLNYRVIITNSDTSGIKIKMIVCAGTVTDIDGNVYQTVKIGDQEWTVENLRTTRYNDGSAIPNITDSIPWESCLNTKTGAYCYHSNTTNAAFIKKYGALYNWYAVRTKKIVPDGWHVPSKEEWVTLEYYLIDNGYNWDGTTANNKIAKSLAAKTGWKSSSQQGVIGNDPATNNSSGFSALPGGYRYKGKFDDISRTVRYWSATKKDSLDAYHRTLNWNYKFLARGGFCKSNGWSVRLLRD